MMRLSAPRALSLTTTEALTISKPPSVREAAVQKLRQAIVEGVLPPGSRLSEAKIAQAMGISRAPLREAMFQLEREGLLQHEPQHGARVMQVSQEEIAEIYQLRAFLERGAAETVASSLSL
jgi:DNA-binding GntR family transcriptional regulator